MSQKEFIDVNAAYAFGAAATMIQVLKQCGNDLSRDNVMKQAANLKDLQLPMLLTGHEDQHLADQFQPDPSDAARALRRRELAAVRRDPDGLSAGRSRALPFARGLVRLSLTPIA